MLKIIDDLEPFFKDCYRRINVREYARISGVSPPTASKLLCFYVKEGLLKEEKERIFNYYYADKESKSFILLSRLFWLVQFNKSGLLTELEAKLVNPTVVLFGSLSKAEANPDSDIDLAIFTPSKKKLDLSRFEKVLGRKIQAFLFTKRDEVKSAELLNNILNGHLLAGGW